MRVHGALRTLYSDRRAIQIAGVLVAIDLFFVVVHGIKFIFKEDFIELFGYWIYRNLTITNDWSIPEITNYLKFVVIVFLLCRIFAVARQPIYLAWAFVYAVALLDDSLQVHETLGEYIATLLGNSSLPAGELLGDEGLRVQDIGELIVYAAYAGSFSLFLGLGFLWSEPLHRRIGLGFGVLLAGLAFFVTAVDMIDRIAISHSATLARVLATLEDSGEMIMISLTVAFALLVYRRLSTPRSRIGGATHRIPD